MSGNRNIPFTVLAALVAGSAAFGCKGGQGPAGRAGTTGGLGLTDGETLPAYLHNLADISLIADRGRRQVVVSAPAGSVTSQTPDAHVTVWEVAADVTATKYKVDGNTILLPARLRGETPRAPDGSFNVEIAYAGAGAVIVSTDADPATGVVILRKDATGISAGLKNPYDESPLKPLGYADFTGGVTDPSASDQASGTSVTTSAGWDG